MPERADRKGTAPDRPCLAQARAGPAGSGVRGGKLYRGRRAADRNPRLPDRGTLPQAIRRRWIGGVASTIRVAPRAPRSRRAGRRPRDDRTRRDRGLGPGGTHGRLQQAGVVLPRDGHRPDAGPRGCARRQLRRGPGSEQARRRRAPRLAAPPRRRQPARRPRPVSDGPAHAEAGGGDAPARGRGGARARRKPRSRRSRPGRRLSLHEGDALLVRHRGRDPDRLARRAVRSRAEDGAGFRPGRQGRPGSPAGRYRRSPLCGVRLAPFPGFRRRDRRRILRGGAFHLPAARGRAAPHG